MIVGVTRWSLSVAIAACLGCAVALAQTPGSSGIPRPPRLQFYVTTDAWPDGGEVPVEWRGNGKSPRFEFHWSLGMDPASAPDTLQSYAVILRDLDEANNIQGLGLGNTTVDTLHWAAFNIPGTAKSLPEGLSKGDLPDGTRNGPGLALRRGQTPAYFGPGAVLGPFHHYVFEFYALDALLDLPADTTREELLSAMNGHVIGKAAWFGRSRSTTPRQ